MAKKQKRKRKKIKMKRKLETEQMRLERVSLSKCLVTKVKLDKKKYTRKEKYK